MQTYNISIWQEISNFPIEYFDPIQQKLEKWFLSDLKWFWIVLFFYPGDFTFVCPTELNDLQKYSWSFTELKNVKILAISTDSVYTHKSRLENDKLLDWFSYPMVADRNKHICETLGVLDIKTGNALRSTCIISPTGILKAVEIVPDNIWRSTTELLRKLKALQYTSEHPDQNCPASREEYMPTINSDIQTSWHVKEQFHPLFKKVD